MMSLIFRNFCSFMSPVNLVQTQFVPVRYRYYADKIAKGPRPMKFGYKEKIFNSGILPRLKDAPRLPQPIYKPKDPWTPERVALGQNDYIDLLGGGKVKPPDVAYDVPKWLRGKKGNEFQLLLIKRKVYKNTLYEYENPTLWKNIQGRISRLYTHLNRKTKTGFSDKQ